MVGGMLTTDIMFGNLNKMVTCWVVDDYQYFEQDRFKIEGFHLGDLDNPDHSKSGFKEVH